MCLSGPRQPESSLFWSKSARHRNAQLFEKTSRQNKSDPNLINENIEKKICEAKSMEKREVHLEILAKSKSQPQTTVQCLDGFIFPPLLDLVFLNLFYKNVTYHQKVPVYV